MYLIFVGTECAPQILEGSSSLWTVYFMRSTAAMLVIKQMNKGIEQTFGLEKNKYTWRLLLTVPACETFWNKKNSLIPHQEETKNFWRILKKKQPQKNTLQGATVQGHLQDVLVLVKTDPVFF